MVVVVSSASCTNSTWSSPQSTCASTTNCSDCIATGASWCYGDNTCVPTDGGICSSSKATPVTGCFTTCESCTDPSHTGVQWCYYVPFYSGFCDRSLTSCTRGGITVPIGGTCPNSGLSPSISPSLSLSPS